MILHVIASQAILRACGFQMGTQCEVVNKLVLILRLSS
jgi:hypothetical protein